MLQLIRTNKLPFLGLAIVLPALLFYIGKGAPRAIEVVTWKGVMTDTVQSIALEWWGWFYQALIVAITVIYFQLLVHQESLFRKKNWVFLCVALLFGFKVIPLDSISVMVLSMPLLVFIYHQLLIISRKDRNAKEFFNLAFACGVGFLIDGSFIILVLLLSVVLAQFSGFNLRKWLLYCTGFLIPIFWSLSLDWLVHHDFIWMKAWDFRLYNSFEWVLFPLLFGIGVFLFVGASLLNLQTKFSRLIVFKRNFHQTNFLIFIWSLLVFLLRAKFDYWAFGYLVLPVAILLSDWFITMKKVWVYETIFALFMLLFVFEALF